MKLQTALTLIVLSAILFCCNVFVRRQRRFLQSEGQAYADKLIGAASRLMGTFVNK